MFAFRDLVEQHVDELARIVASEHGKVVEDAKGEVIRGMEVVEFACGIPQLLKGEYSDQVSTDVDSFSFRQPLGVCAGITPFNFPVMVPMWMHPMAIATGNTFVLKPSERDPSASNFIAELYAEAGLPDGVFNVVHGDKVAVDALLDHPDVDARLASSARRRSRSTSTSAASATGKRVQALGGAKNHAVVMPDADLDFAANHLTAAGYGSAGQRCMAISVAVAVGDAADAAGRAAEREGARRSRSARASSPTRRWARSSPPQARDRIVGYIDGATRRDVVVDGRELDVDGDGFFVGPTLLDNVTPDMDVYRDEIFGPVLGGRARGHARRGDRADQRATRTPTAPRSSPRSGQAARTLPAPGPGRDDRHQRPDPGADGLLLASAAGRTSLFGDHHIHGPEGIRFYTRGKVVTSRWPEDARRAPPRPHALPDRGMSTSRPSASASSAPG